MSNRTCGVPGCPNSYFSNGWCAGHFSRVRRKGDPEAHKPLKPHTPKYPWPENLLRKLLFCPPGPLPTGCIEFMAARNERGYGTLWVNGRQRYAHILAYEMAHGPVPQGKELDHLCENPPCCHPGHLEPVPHKENVRRWREGR